MKKVEIYTEPTCAPCRLAKGFMQQNKIKFTELGTDDAPSSVKSVPTVLCKNGESLEYKFEGFSIAIGNKIKQWYSE